MLMERIEPGGGRGLVAPPGPWLPWPVQTAIFTWWRHLWAKSLREKYGDVIALDIYPWRKVILLYDPAHIGAMFTSPPSRFNAGEGNRVMSPVMGEQSVFMADGAEHRRLRRLMAPLFGKTAVRGYLETVQELTEKEVDTWPLATTFESHDRMRELTLDIMSRVTFGMADGRIFDELRAQLGKLLSMDLAVLMGLNVPAARRYGPWRRALELLHSIDVLIYATIEERRGVPDLAQRDDVLSRLLVAGEGDDRLSPKEIRDQVITLLIAGHETTATGLAWALHELARNPRVAKEATRAALTDDTAYLDAVVKESLRLHPVIFEVTWTLTEDVELAGFLLPKGATLMPMIGIVQNDPANHPAPDEFRPERFLGPEIPPSTWIPFGGGARRCVGANFAMMEAVEVLRVLLSRRAITTDRRKPEAASSKHVAFAPARGARISAPPLAEIDRAMR
ncbi:MULTISPECIES: cytochrome P450 [unclassified Nocardia]|uniref:cytochrome P450 n=1 Tax=unclassified Nocardia TaxID=2637762 RepID=UPI001CE446EC|nr:MULTISPECIES: cytochrome P450 [unclassified Nocardia]